MILHMYRQRIGIHIGRDWMEQNASTNETLRFGLSKINGGIWISVDSDNFLLFPCVNAGIWTNKREKEKRNDRRYYVPEV